MKLSITYFTGSLFVYRQTVVYECDEGYHLEGAEWITCLETGMWSDHAPKCVRNFCGEPPSIENGKVSGKCLNRN